MTDSTYSPLGHKGALLLDKATRRACGRNFLHNGAENDAVQGRLLFERADDLKKPKRCAKRSAFAADGTVQFTYFAV